MQVVVTRSWFISSLGSSDRILCSIIILILKVKLNVNHYIQKNWQNSFMLKNATEKIQNLLL